MRFAADAARITDEKASSEDRKRTSGGVFVAADSKLGAVVGKKEGVVASIAGNEGIITQAGVNVRGGVGFLHTSGTRRDGPQEMQLSWSGAEESQGHTASVAGGM